MYICIYIYIYNKHIIYIYMCVLLLLFPPAPPRSLELFTHVFAVGFCWSTVDVSPLSPVKRCQNSSNCFFSSHSCQKKMCFPSCPPHFPCMFHHVTILNSIGVPLILPGFHLHFPCIFHIFHWFSTISPSFPCIFHGFLAFWLVVSGAFVGRFSASRTRRSSPTRPSTAAGTSGHWTWRPRCATANGWITWCPGWMGKIGRLSRDIYG